MSKYLDYSEDKKLKIAVRLTFVVILIGILALGGGIAYILFGLEHGTATEIPYTPKVPEGIHGVYEDYEYTIKKETDAEGNYFRFLVLDKYNGKEKNIKIPGEINGIPVKVVGNSCFMNNEYIESLSTMGNLKEIDNFAFYQCKNLSNIHFVNNSVTRIGERAFEKCDALTSVTFPSDIEIIDFSAFANCTKLEEIEFSGSPVLEIDAYAFSNTALIKVKLPNFTKSIGKCAFANCKNLTNLYIPERADYAEDITSQKSNYSYYKTTERTTEKQTEASTAYSFTESSSHSDTESETTIINETESTTTYRPWFFRMFDRLH